MPWAVYSRKFGGSLMYFMIHATDHPVAPGLMSRAYNKAVSPPETHEQLALDMGVTPIADKNAAGGTSTEI